MELVLGLNKPRYFVALACSLVAQLLAVGDELAERVVILANSRQSDSVRLAEYYADKRAIPRANIVALPMPEDESITWRTFIDQVYQPLQDALFERGWLEGTPSSLLDALGRKRYSFTANKISYLVACKGVPLRIYNDPTLLDPKKQSTTPAQFYTNESSVDGELSLLGQSGYEITAMVTNPLLNNSRPSVFDTDLVVKVSRLDGPSWESVRRLITSAIEGEKQGLIGRYYIDIGGPHKQGDDWLKATREQIQKLGYDGAVDGPGSMFAADSRFDAPALYFGWYAGEANGPFVLPEMRFAPGAIALHIHSFSATSIRSETGAWVGPLIARGVAVTMGNVFEPYLELTHRPNLFMQALARGDNVGDALYFSLPALSWKCIAIGDPLYRPFKVSLAEQEKNFKALPYSLSSYVILRRANLLQSEGKLSEAVELLKKAVKQQPDFVLPVGLAKALIAIGKPKEAVDTLAFLALVPSVRPVDWGLMREVAALLAAQNAKPVALKIYQMLARAKPPSKDALKVLLAEARGVADSARDLKLSLEFARQLNELTAPPIEPEKNFAVPKN